MALDWFRSSKKLTIDELIARKKYDEAAGRIREQLTRRRSNPRLRQLLADVLLKGGKIDEAAEMLVNLADEHALAGQPAKAIAVLKRIQRAAPGNTDVDERLAHLIKERDQPGQRPWSEQTADQGAFPEREMEELDLGLEAVALGVEQAEVSDPGTAPAPASDSASFFDGFTEAELVAVMRGLELRSYAAGDIIVSEGEPGDSLFVVTTGVVKAWVKDARGRNRLVREMREGDFFGEIAVIDGGARTATITSALSAELLELSSATLASIAETHPNVPAILRSFRDERANSGVESSIRSSGQE